MSQLFRTGIVAGVLIASTAVGLHAQPTVTEDQVTDAVRSENLEIRAARTSAEADATRRDQVTWPFPMVEAELMPDMITDGELGVRMMARQTLPRAGILRAEREARARMAQASEHGAEALARERVMDARMAYAMLWRLQEQIALLDSFRTRTDIYEEAALAQYRAGRGPQQAALQVQIENEMLAQRLESLSEEGTSFRQRLALLTGGRIDLTSSDRLAPPLAAVQVGGDELRQLENHPTVAANRAMRQSEEAMVDANRALGRPEFSVGVALDLSPMARERMFGREPVMPAVGVMIPLWRSGIRASVEEAEVRVRQRQLETDHVELSLATELEDVLEQLRQVRSRIQRYEQRLRPRVELTREATTSGYRAGTSRLIELLDVERTALDLEMDLLMARAREAELVARLRFLIGE